MWKLYVSHVNPFLLNLLLVMVFHHSNSNPSYESWKIKEEIIGSYLLLKKLNKAREITQMLGVLVTRAGS